MRGRKPAIPHEVTIEAWFFLVAAIGAIALHQFGIITVFFDWIATHGPLVSSLVAGLAYSTFITIPLSLAGFIEMGTHSTTPVWQIALVGGVGAAITDLLLMKGFRSPLAALIVRGVTGSNEESFKTKMRRNPFLRYLAVALGGICMAAPLPTDELGVVFLSVSRFHPITLFPIIYLANTAGIYAVVSAARVLSGA
ncbi:hypothetical protein C4585_03430 [Candidatus Parcubacteria bacterium]|nr:MAG: hypothetical protein C4585_03430 [Candidatus Parcubacteria bacterium]